MKKVVIGSLNPVKLQSATIAFQKIWTNQEFNISGVKVDSGVSDQPMSDAESIRGVMNRIKNIQEPADYKVAIEGGIQQIGDKWFSCGWAAVDQQGELGLASSVRIELPSKIIQLIHQGKELAEIDNIIFNTNNSGHGQGNFGLMTKGVITRESAYTNAVICALSRFLHSDLY